MKLLTVILMWTVVTISAGASGTYKIEVVKQPQQKWRFQHLMAFASGEGTRVAGRMTATSRSGLPRGHIDVAAFSPTGKLIVETTTNYIPSILTYRQKRKGGVRFSAVLSEKLPPYSVIKVAFHRDRPYARLKPRHAGNIAR